MTRVHHGARWALVATIVAGSVGVLLAQDMPVLPQARPNRQPGQLQNPNPNGPKPPNGDQISPAYIQQMFDAMAVVEAERFLPLTAEQYPGFVQKLRRLQDARAQLNRRRMAAMNALRNLAGAQAAPDVPDSLIEAKIKELTAIEQEGQAAVQKALDDLDVGLTVRQRARYRLLEEQVERRKVDFLTKVRQGGGFEGIPR